MYFTVISELKQLAMFITMMGVNVVVAVLFEDIYMEMKN